MLGVMSRTGEGLLRLERILIDLKRKKLALEAAIAALESLQKGQRRYGARTVARTNRATRNSKGKFSAVQAQIAADPSGGRVIPFPKAKRSGRGRQGSEEVKA